MWYNEKFVYYSNSPGFYAIYFLGKKLFWCYTMYNWDVKTPGKEKKTIIVRNTNLVWCLLDCLFCLSKLLLLLLPGWLFPLSSLLFHRPRAACRASPGTLRIARYFTHDQCGEWKYSDFRGEISYFTHELYAQNCIKKVFRLNCLNAPTKWYEKLTSSTILYHSECVNPHFHTSWYKISYDTRAKKSFLALVA